MFRQPIDRSLIECMMRRGIWFSLALLSISVPAFAQGAPARGEHPVLLVGGQYGGPTRLVGTAGVLIAPPRPFTPGSSPDSSRAGFVVHAGAGTGGIRVAAGGAALAFEGPFLTTGFDGLFTLTRTRQAPRGASPDSTYVGAEAGLVIMSVRFSAGVARRAAGPAGPHATIVTWSLGLQLPIGW
jgi:hypothetical protein